MKLESVEIADEKSKYYYSFYFAINETIIGLFKKLRKYLPDTSIIQIIQQNYYDGIRTRLDHVANGFSVKYKDNHLELSVMSIVICSNLSITYSLPIPYFYIPDYNCVDMKTATINVVNPISMDCLNSLVASFERANINITNILKTELATQHLKNLTTNNYLKKNSDKWNFSEELV